MTTSPTWLRPLCGSAVVPLSLVLLGSMVPGCNSYDPDLGPEPFRCGTDEPRCPEDYVCDVRSETEHFCVRKDISIPDRPDAMAGLPDSLSFTCNDDSQIGSNDSVINPTITPIPDLRDDYPLAGLAICPTTDVDIFQFRTNQSGKNIRVDISFSALQGSLLLDILNSSGVSVRQGAVVEGNPNIVRATFLTAPAGVYYAEVRATPGVENNYSIHIITTGP